MAKIGDLLAYGRTYSFEFFPPKTDKGEQRLRRTLRELEPLKPSFVSVTYGAGGSTRDRTHAIVVDLLRDSPMTPMAHLTAYAHTREELRTILQRYREAGVENILALRGDPPRDDPDAPPGDLEHAVDLVRLAREVGGSQFSVGVAAHPEGHPLSPDMATDRKYLAQKLEEADFGITQFFFRAPDYRRMLADLDGLGVDTPVIAGVIPVTNVKQITRFAELSGAAFPPELAERFHAVDGDADRVRRLGVEVATDLCADVLEAGAPGIHFYTLNRSTATREIFQALSLPTPDQARPSA